MILRVSAEVQGFLCGFGRGPATCGCAEVVEGSVLVGEVEDEANADGLQEVGSGLVSDSRDGADAELGDANVHVGKNLEIEAGEALVGDAVVDDDAAVLERERAVEGGAGGLAAVGAGEADGSLDVGASSLYLVGKVARRPPMAV